MRRAFEVLPARAKLDLTLRKVEGGAEIVLDDDAPPLSVRDAATAFEPGPEAATTLSLCLPFARRALRRWGGDARLEKSTAGGSRIVLAVLASTPLST